MCMISRLRSVFSGKKVPRAFSPEAQMLWDGIPHDQQAHIVNSVFCTGCMGNCSMTDYVGSIADGILILDGTCEKCGRAVTRLVDSDDKSVKRNCNVS